MCHQIILHMMRSLSKSGPIMLFIRQKNTLFLSVIDCPTIHQWKVRQYSQVIGAHIVKCPVSKKMHVDFCTCILTTLTVKLCS